MYRGMKFFFQPNGNTCYLYKNKNDIGNLEKKSYAPARTSIQPIISIDDSDTLESEEQITPVRSKAQKRRNKPNLTKRNVTEATKKRIAGQQYYKCANKPGLQLRGLKNYKCPLWQKNNESKGSFDESGYDIDHIIEHSCGGNDSDTNLQALCKSCHLVKTKRFMSM